MAKSKAAATTSKKRQVAPSLVAGFVLALIEMGLPMIGVSVNLWFGGILLTAAFALFAWGLWNFETNRDFGKLARGVTTAVIGLVYFSLMGFQIHSQYKRDHPPTDQNPASASPTKCAGKTGDATANGNGSIANSGNCVEGLGTDQKSQ